MLFRPKAVFITIPIWQGERASLFKGGCERMKQVRTSTLHAASFPLAYTLPSSQRTLPSLGRLPCTASPLSRHFLWWLHLDTMLGYAAAHWYNYFESFQMSTLAIKKPRIFILYVKKELLLIIPIARNLKRPF